MNTNRDEKIEETVREFYALFDDFIGDIEYGDTFKHLAVNKDNPVVIDDIARWLRITLAQVRQEAERGREENILETLTYDEAIKWWLDHYEGMEHMHVKPEAMYTITSILKRCFNQIKSKTN